MEVNYAFLCDYADTTGKVTAVGIGINTIYAPKVPIRHPLFYAVIELSFSGVETGEKRLGVRIIDADGRAVVPPLDAPLNVASPPAGYLHMVQRIALALHGVEFRAYGDYSVHWLVDGHEVKTVPLRVAAPPQTAST